MEIIHWFRNRARSFLKQYEVQIRNRKHIVHIKAGQKASSADSQETGKRRTEETHPLRRDRTALSISDNLDKASLNIARGKIS